MKLTQRLMDLIEEQDIDEGDVLNAIVLDVEATRVEIEAAIRDFLMAIPEYSDMEDWKITRYVDVNLLADDEEDLSADDEMAVPDFTEDDVSSEEEYLDDDEEDDVE